MAGRTVGRTGGGAADARHGSDTRVTARHPGGAQHGGQGGRGLHSSTLQLNFSAFCVTRGAVRGCFGGVQGLEGGIRGVNGVLLCQKRLKLS